MKYKILRTGTADDQLRDIIFYIADESGDIYAIVDGRREYHNLL